MKKTLLLALIIAMALVASPATAGDDWEFTLTPYLWFAGLNGQVASVPGSPPADVDASFSDILDNLDMGLFLAGGARKGRWGMTADLMYIDLSAGGEFPGPEFSDVNLETSMWMVSGVGTYRAYGDDGPFVDLVAGFRFWDVDSDLMLHAGAYPDTLIESGANWFDPMVGARGRTPIGESRFSFGGHVLAGGFGAGSDMMWDLRADFGYHWEKTALILGYRYLDVKYEDSDFLFDVTQDGPILGFIWNF